MKLKIGLSCLLAFSFFACKNPNTEKEPIAVVEAYYAMLDKSDYSQIPVLLADSLQTQEGEHTSSYSHEDYEELLKWDAVFEPTYEVVDIVKEGNGTVKATVSKSDTRIQFLHEKPFITDNFITVEDGKITKVRTAYVDFDDATFGDNRTRILTYIDENHPELNGFLTDQTEAGGKKYLKAISLYRDKPRFNKGKDLLLMHFDCKTDVDDLHSVAGLRTLMSQPLFSEVKYHAVAGTYGIQDGLYVPPNPLFQLAFGNNWTDAHNRMESAAREVAKKASATLEAEGDIWIAEAGQSDFSAHLIKELQEMLPDLETKKRIHIVQHSNWNEETTSPEYLAFAKQQTDYNKIPDGNEVGNGTPGFRTPGYTQWKEEITNPDLKAIWELAVDTSNEYNGKDGRYLNEAVAADGLDFSDLSEVCWMLRLDDIKDTDEFFKRFTP